jgi:riboflavin kinase/FMN adenylyltransferase
MCAGLDIELMLVPDVVEGGCPVSSTRIKEALAGGDAGAAERMLGRRYGLKLPVYEEKRVARRLGFPTINQRFPEGLAAPKYGVYYTEAIVDGVSRPAVSNFGVRPSVGENGGLSLETHILDFSGDLYGREITVEFVRFLREERRFDSMEKLKEAVERDMREARAIGKR